MSRQARPRLVVAVRHDSFAQQLCFSLSRHIRSRGEARAWRQLCGLWREPGLASRARRLASRARRLAQGLSVDSIGLWHPREGVSAALVHTLR
ncbi:hypothetical protein NDU88_010323 [Pleurodeles waltl]|uniref:Uncharacterized protein n=1 Tax=Pleurodeles waltl TaxID=8319 RepID=A0AAV7PUU3_PLEWA|nr:hypothetical protein NDU88_010323 [Pleurodeles waltl]